MRASIQGVTTALSVTLVICTGALIGSIAVTNGNRSTADARRTGDEGVVDCASAAMGSVKEVAGRLTAAILKEMKARINGYLDVPESAMLMLLNTLRSYSPDQTTSPAWINTTMRYMLYSTHRSLQRKGGRHLGYYPLNYSANSDPHSWGGSIAMLTADEYLGVVPSDGLVNLVLETRDDTDTFLQHNEESWVLGNADEMGRIDTKGGTRVECIDNGTVDYSSGGVIGVCKYQWVFLRSPGWDEMHGRCLHNMRNDGELDEADMLNYAPIVRTISELDVYIYSCWSHPDMIDRWPRQQKRVGQLQIAMSAESIQKIVREQDLPSGSILYIVQRNYWRGSEGHLIGLNVGDVTRYFIDPTFNLTFAEPIHVANHSHPVVRSHGQYALEEMGGYENAVRKSDEGSDEWHYNTTVFFSKMCSVQRGKGFSRLKWYIVLLIPRDQMIKDIDTTLASIKARNEQQKEASDHRKNRGFITMLVLTGIAVVVLLTLSLFFTNVIITPLIRLQRDMASVAVMELEAVDMNDPLSQIEEVSCMQESFRVMVKNLHEYRNYMPQSILIPAADSKPPDEVLEDEYSSRGSEETDDEVTPSAHHSADAHLGCPVLLSERIAKRSVSAAAFNLVGFHEFMGEVTDWDIFRKVHAEVITILLQSVRANQGVSDTFSGDRLLSTFNAVIPTATHRHRCLVAAVCARERLRVPPFTPVLSFAVGSGKARVGNVGCRGMKKFTVFSPVVPWVVALERRNKELECGGLADMWIRSDTHPEYDLRCVDLVYFSKRALEPIRVYQVLGSSGPRDDDWIYQSPEEDNPSVVWDEAVTCIFRNEWKEAGDLLRKYSGPLDKVYDRMVRCVEAKRYRPVASLSH